MSAGLYWLERVQASEQKIGDMAMLIRQLSSALKKANPDSGLPKKAMDYLRRHSLQGSVLRDGTQKL